MQFYTLLSFFLVALGPLFGQRVEVRQAPLVYMPAPVDSNSPAFWRDGQLVILNSVGLVLTTSGRDQFYMEDETTDRIEVETATHTPLWIEAVWVDSDGAMYAWYHHEPGGLCPESSLTAPEIGALVSYDGGRSFVDWGIVLSSGDPLDCQAQNGFFAGGHGDFSVIPDRENGYFYFLFTNYAGDPSGQGVAIARMAFEDRNAPVGKVFKYFQGAWEEEGLGGSVTAIFPAKTRWERANADSFWGPSIHGNTHLNTYVVLLNRACCQPRWPQEGIYISYNPDLSKPFGWTEPSKILSDIGFSPGYYPQVLGTQPGETDSVAGKVARLYVHGISYWELVFF
jgi:hypothetical protein